MHARQRFNNLGKGLTTCDRACTRTSNNRFYTLLWRNVAEYSFLLVIVAAHPLVSFAFLLSDEFFELTLHQKVCFSTNC